MGIPLTREGASKGEYCMQGRQNQGNDAWDRERSTAARLAALNARVNSQGTGKHKPIVTSTSEHRAIPKPPPHRPHLDARPEMPRAPRPEYQPPKPKKRRPVLIVLGAIVAIIVIIAFVLIFSLINAINQSAGPATTAVNFLSSVSNKDYKGAYQYLGSGVTLRINQDEFTTQAGNLDTQDGAITNYTEVAGSAAINNNIQSYTYTITREKMSKTYALTLLLRQDPNDNNWKIVDYGTKCYDTTGCGMTLAPTP